MLTLPDQSNIAFYTPGEEVVEMMCVQTVGTFEITVPANIAFANLHTSGLSTFAHQYVHTECKNIWKMSLILLC